MAVNWPVVGSTAKHAMLLWPRLGAYRNRPDAVIYAHPYGIVVNGEGRRFFDEGRGTVEETFELIAFEVWKNQEQQAPASSQGNSAQPAQSGGTQGAQTSADPANPAAATPANPNSTPHNQSQPEYE